MSNIKGSSLEKLVPVMLIVSVGLAFAVGALWQKVTNLEGGPTTGAVAGAGTAGAPAAGDPGAEVSAYTELTEDQAEKVAAVSEEDHIKGSLDADVFLVEYSDFECPFCQRFHPTAQQAIDEYEGKVAWVYRHYPLEMIHPNANKAAQASECVAELAGGEAFWDYADKLFANTANLTNLTKVAGELGVDEGAFDGCLESGKYADKVKAHLEAGTEAGVTGTPATFVVNKNGDSWMIAGAMPYETVKEAIDLAFSAL